ncbi:hypothetical protein FOZ62_020736 [Perkinsus olseni]|uniref:Uncharacterized protein n=1 Tax=Perkinsus olseni TaxID=32597 RepID=A0A7J6RW46_PEROL|nr:hypothetical protein FOZ62_020736 [Perkinsus olseni]
MRSATLPLCLAAVAELVQGQSACPTGDAQCQVDDPLSYCKYYLSAPVCKGSNKPCSCITPPPPCPEGDVYCQQVTGDPASYCKAAYQFGPGGGVCRGSDDPCTCGGSSTTSEPTSGEPTTPEPTTSETTPPGPTTGEPTTPGPTTSETTTPGPTTGEPTYPGPTTTPGPTSGETTSSITTTST